MLSRNHRPIPAGQGEERSHCCKSAPTIAYRGDQQWTITGQPLGHHWNTCSSQELSIGELSTGSHLTNHVEWGLRFPLIFFWSSTGTAAAGWQASTPTEKRRESLVQQMEIHACRYFLHKGRCPHRERESLGHVDGGAPKDRGKAVW